MLLIYGEGKERAIRRLRRHIKEALDDGHSNGGYASFYIPFSRNECLSDERIHWTSSDICSSLKISAKELLSSALEGLARPRLP